MHNEEEHSFHEVAKEIEKAEQLLVVGPGLAKHVVGVETVDNKISDNQILEFARKFFKVYNQYHSSI